MKTVQFHRNKEELRDELLLSLMQDQPKHKNKKKSKSKQSGIRKPLSKQHKKEIIHNDVIQPQYQQSNQVPRIKLKLKKKTQNQINKLSAAQNQPLLPVTSKVNQHIKKAIQQQLLGSFYNHDKTKQVDNRKTAYRQDDENDSEIVDQEMSHKNASTVKTKDRQERCLKILQQRNNRVINSFLEENSKEELIKRDESLKKSIKLIPKNQVYIPKSFITFTIKRKQLQQNEVKQNKLLKPNASQKYLSMKYYPNQQVQRVNDGLRQKNRSVSSVQFQGLNGRQIDKKMAFYSRDKKSGQLKTQLKRQIKESSIKRTKQVKKGETEEELHTKERKRRQIRCITQLIKTQNEDLNEKSIKVSLRKSIQKSNKTIERNNVNILLEKDAQKDKDKKQISKKQQKDESIKVHSQKRTQIIPLVKMTESLYEEKSHLINSYQQEQSLSFTSSLNYSTPFPSVQQTDSKQLTINKLSTISKKPQPEMPVSPSPPKYEEVPLKFTQAKEEKKNDILTASLTKFKYYEKKKQEMEKQRENLQAPVVKQIQSKAQLYSFKENEEFNDFDEIFLQANEIGINKIKIEQMKKKNEEKIKESERNKTRSQKIKIAKQVQHQKKEIKTQPQIEENSTYGTKIVTKQFQKSIPNKIEISNEFQKQSTKQQKQITDNNDQQLPSQLSIQESSIQKSVSDFTPQPSLAEIRINDQPLLVGQQKQRQKLKQQTIESKGIVEQKSYQHQQIQNLSQPQQVHQKCEFSIEEFDYYKFEDIQTVKQEDLTKKSLHFDDFPDWKYNDKRDNFPQTVKVTKDEKKVIEILKFQMKKVPSTSIQKIPFGETNGSIASKTQEPPMIQISKVETQKQKMKQLISGENNEGSEQISSIQRPKSTTNKVRLIENVEISSSSQSSQDQQWDKQPKSKSGEIRTDNKEFQVTEAVQNRYYSSSDQYDEQQQQNDLKQIKIQPKKQKKLILQKQSSLKKTFTDNQSKTNQKPLAQISKQKVIPLGIKINKPKDLFPVLQDSQQWIHAAESVGEIQRKLIPNNNFQKTSTLKGDLNIKNQTSILDKVKKQKQQKIKIVQDTELDLLEKQFSQPSMGSKSQQFKTEIHSQQTINKKQSQSSKSLSDFSQSDDHNDKSNITQELSDFSRQLSDHQVPISIVENKNSIQTSKMKKPSQKQNQLDQIQKQRHIVSDLKNHVNSLLKRISSQHSISPDQNSLHQKPLDFEQIRNNSKNQSSFISNSTSIKPVQMSHSESLVAKQSFVEEYEENNVRQSIVKSKNQRKEDKSRSSSNAYKKYEKSDTQKDLNIETNPLFDFSDKNSSDNQRKNKISQVKKYSQSSNNSKSFSSDSNSERQKNSQISNKEEILRQFDKIARQSQKDFSKNKSYYLRHKENGRQKVFDDVLEKIPILMPTKTTKKNDENKDSFDTLIRQPDHQKQVKKYSSETEKISSSDGSSGETINHKDLEVVPQSLYVTNAKNTGSNKIIISQVQPRESLKMKKGLSISKKVSSNSYDEEKSSSFNVGKTSNNNSSISMSDELNASKSGHNQSSSVIKQKVIENQSLWNFIMKK